MYFFSSIFNIWMNNFSYSKELLVLNYNAVIKYDNLLSNIESSFFNSLNDYYNINQIPYYVSYKLRQFLCDSIIYFVPISNFYTDIVNIFFINTSYNLIGVDLDFLEDLFTENFENIINYNNYYNDSLQYFEWIPLSSKISSMFFDLNFIKTFDYFNTVNFTKFVKEFNNGIYFLFNVDFVVQYKLTLDLENYNFDNFYNSFESNTNNFFILFENNFLIMFLSFFFFSFLIIFLITIINYFFKKNTFILNGQMNKINKLFEYDFGANSELKFFFIFFFFSFFFFFFKNFNNSLNFNQPNDYFIFYFLFIFFIVILYPFLYILNFGFYFMSYIKGTDVKHSNFLNFFFDTMSLLSYFSRFFLQLIRILLLGIVYYLMHEYLFENILNNMFFNYYYYKDNNYFLIVLFNFLRFVYELCDFFMIFFLQIVSFFSVIFVLFSFLFSSNLNMFYENFIKKK